MHSSNLLAHLNPEQLDAVTLPHTSALILAGAGSGKTRVLTTRIAWLLQSGQASPSSVLAVTFTNKAAKEMLTRLSAMTPYSTRGMWVGTFHGLCNRMLRTHWREAQLPQHFQILDSQDQLALIKRVYKAHGIDDERFPARQFQQFVNSAKEEGQRPNQVEAFDDFTRRQVEHFALYEQACQREGVVDFAELLLRCHELLSRDETLRTHYQRRFTHILVDEFQDTNKLQYRWLRLLAGPGSAVFAVGDDDQSIYAFRGANAANMQHFEREFGPIRLIKLEQNYRSQGNILDAANALIRHNNARLGKNLWTSEGKGEPVRAYIAPSDTDEAAFVVDAVKSLVADGVSPADVAVLYRSNAQSRVLEHALFNAGMPYRVYGGMRFFERAEVKHALAYLRLLASPEDDGALLRVVNFPPRGIGARSLETLQERAGSARTSLWQAACSQPLGGKSGASVAAFVGSVEAMRGATRGLSLPEMVEHVLHASGLIAHYRAERDGQERVENLEELVNAAGAFVREVQLAGGLPEIDAPASGPPALAVAAPEIPEPRPDAIPSPTPADVPSPTPIDVPQPPPPAIPTPQPADVPPTQPSDVPPPGSAAPIDAMLAAFLAHAALEAGETQAAEGRPALQLMTVHSAKGLEFHTVFVTGLEEGLFPHENSLSEADGVEEERRLMYVAITRARRRLYLTQAQTRMLHGQLRYHIASRFFEEIPAALIQWLSPTPSSRRGRWEETELAVAHAGSGGGYGRSGSYGSGRSGGYARGGQAAPPRNAALATHPGVADSGWRIGQSVQHAKFGVGIIVDAKGHGPDVQVQVNFHDGGLKWLALEYARLSPA